MAKTNKEETSKPVNHNVGKTAYRPDLDNKPKDDNLVSQGRGWSLYSSYNLIPQTALDTRGNLRNVKIEGVNYFQYIPPWECDMIAQLDSDIFSIVSQRSQIFSGMEDKIVPIKNIEDEISYELKRNYRIALQYDTNNPREMTAYAFYWNKINEYLSSYNLRPDLSNFDSCMKIFFDDVKFFKRRSAQEVLDWIYQPRPGSQIQDFKKKWVYDNLIHGRNAIQLPTKDYDYFSLVPGGTIFHVPEVYVGEYYNQWYLQMTYGLTGWSGNQEAKLFSSNDFSTAQYLPVTSNTNGLKPIDALMHFIITSANLNELIAENSNGERPPEYMILVTDNGNDENSGYGYETYDNVEQERQEQSLNERRKDKEVRIHKMTGNRAELFNLSRESLINTLSPYTEYVRNAKALAFHATPNEMGKTETGGMIAKAGAEAQEELYYSQSINPLARMWENQFTLEILPKKFYRVNDGRRVPIWKLELKQDRTLQEKIDLAKALKETSSVTRNELREVMDYERTTNPDDDNMIDGTPQQPENQDIMMELKRIANRR